MLHKIKNGFSLSEILIAIAIIGIIAVIVTPAMRTKYRENINKIKIKKAISKYEHIVSNLVAEHRFTSVSEFKKWADNSENECKNTAEYFKIDKGKGCIFKTTDDVWWYIGDMERAIVSLNKITDIDELKEKADSTEDNTAFYMVTSFDKNGFVYINNKSYEIKNPVDRSDQYMEKLMGYIYGMPVTARYGKLISEANNLCNTQCKLERGDYGSVCPIGQKKSCQSKEGCMEMVSLGDTLPNPIARCSVYDEYGNEILNTNYNGNIITYKTYDEQGVVQEYIKTEYNSNGDIKRKQDFVPLYDDDGSLIKDLEVKNEEWRRDDDGNLTNKFVAENTFYSDGSRQTTYKTTDYTKNSSGDIIMINAYGMEDYSGTVYEIYLSQEYKAYQGDMSNGKYTKTYGNNWNRVKTEENGVVVYHETTTNGSGNDLNPSEDNFDYGYNKYIQKTKENGEVYFEYYRKCDENFANCKVLQTCKNVNLKDTFTCPAT